MKLEQIAIQLYTLRDFCKTTAEYAETLKRVRAIGYQAIQISGVGPIPLADLRSIAHGEGLIICATHESSAMILEDPAQVVDRLAALGCKHTSYPFPSGIDFNSAAHVDALCAKLDKAGEVLRKAGQVLSYHNHAHEFYRTGGRTILESIYARTSPENLQAELDTYWVQAGGGNPVDWCLKLKGRLPVLHLKDYAVAADGKPFFAEVGSGNLDFKAIVAAAETAGCGWFIVEQDTCPGDPFASIELSFDYMTEHLLG